MIEAALLALGSLPLWWGAWRAAERRGWWDVQARTLRSVQAPAIMEYDDQWTDDVGGLT